MGYDNYPPGVTGGEYQIAGADAEISTTDEVVCDNGGSYTYSNGVTEDWDCQFEGEVEGTLFVYRDESWFVWVCPQCGAEHEKDKGDPAERNL